MIRTIAIKNNFVNHSAIISSTTLSLLCFVCFMFFIKDSQNIYQIGALFITCVFLGILLHPIFIIFIKGGGDLFHPLVLLILYFLPHQVAKSFYILCNGWTMKYGFQPFNLPNYHFIAISLVFLGFLSLLFGFQSKWGDKLAGFIPKFTIEARYIFKSRWLFIIIFIIGYTGAYVLSRITAAHDTPYEISNITALNQILSMADIAFFCIVFGYFADRFSKEKLRWFILPIVFYLIAWLLTGGSRSSILRYLLIFMGAFQFARGMSLSLRQFKMVILLGIISLVFMMLFGTEYRNVLTSSNFKRDRLSWNERVTALQYTVKKLHQKDISSNIQFLTESMNERFIGIDTFINVLSYGKEGERQERAFNINPNIIDQIFFSIVPRAFYPEKPFMMERGKYFGHIYWGSSLQGYSFANITPFVDLYRMGGAFFILIGMFVLGLIIKVIRTWFVMSSSKPNVVASSFYVLTMVGMPLWLETSYGAYFFIISRKLFIFGLFFAMIYFLKGHVKRLV